ncbi:TonB-dependent siderophore receptor [Asticcacaulis sp. AND118]|uniref:TonB-dependent receptor plug domain-containing protein n=1 Tax=Asticcacaulis sp. AND118 TaxID=2840468 RepID=UPI001CFF9D98|nr:TonB-dependent receptor [Asticcacaulis sp. AND118]UDF04882.1 TonB-dependent receptor [Asticcacaulis sp. AND118]
MLKHTLKRGGSLAALVLSVSLTGGLVTAGLAAPALAQSSKAAIAFNIPSQNGAKALNEFARQAGVQLLFPYDAAAKVQTPAIKGTYTREEALARLIVATNFEVASITDTTVSLREKSTASGPQAVEEPQEVVVTGSRLRRPTFESPVPLMILGNEELAQEGYTDIADALTDIPGIDQAASLSNGQSSTQTNGISTISLRGMGSNRTLTLIDGRRTVSNVGNSNTVSLSTIPAAFVDRIEVTTGGASAVYGSDAIAGVVNIKTRTKFDGVIFSADKGLTQDGGGGSSEAGFLAGTSFFGKRLRVMLAANHEEQDILRATDRDSALDSLTYSQTTNTVSGPDVSSYTFGGRFQTSTSSTATKYYFDETSGTTYKTGFVTAINGVDLRPEGTLMTPRTTDNVALKAVYDLGNDLVLKGQLMYSHIVTAGTRYTPSAYYNTTYGINDEFTVGRMNKANPYLALYPTVQAATPTAGLYWYRRFGEVGVMTIDNDRTTLRGIFSLEGKAFGGNWNWDLGYSFGEFEQNQYRSNGLNYENLSYAMKATTVNGQIVCLDTTARANGCVPVNPFGIGSISAAAANYIRANAWYNAKNEQESFTGNITGSLFELPAGPVEAAFGFEVRRDSTRTQTDDQTERGVTSYAYIPRYSGEVKASEVYAEASFPLLRDVPFAYRLNVDAAVRAAKYDLDGVDNTLSYRAGAQWAPVRGLNFRATLARAQRAPNISELYSPPRDDFETVVDPCNGVTATTAGTIAANCRANAGIAAAIAADGLFRQDSTSVNTPNAGNLLVQEETADTVTFGVVFSPSFLPRFQASIDYYDIKVEGVISSLQTAMILNSCYSDGAGTSNRFCGFVNRDSEGQLTRIINRVDNLDEMRAEGIDVAVAYRFDLDQWKVPGRFDARLNYNRRLKLEQSYQGLTGMEVDDWVGEVGGAEDEARASLAWTNKGLMLKWSTRYISDVVDSNERLAAVQAAGTVNPLYLYLDSYTRHDFSFSYKPSTHDGLKIYGNVRNVFDEYGPYLPAGTDSGNDFNYSSVYGMMGRSFQIGFQVEF